MKMSELEELLEYTEPYRELSVLVKMPNLEKEVQTYDIGYDIDEYDALVLSVSIPEAI
jgi:hypothetical protein